LACRRLGPCGIRPNGTGCVAGGAAAVHRLVLRRRELRCRTAAAVAPACERRCARAKCAVEPAAVEAEHTYAPSATKAAQEVRFGGDVGRSETLRVPLTGARGI